MTTLKERFEKYDYAIASCHNHKGDILSFFRQELLALAKEIEAEVPFTPGTDYGDGIKQGFRRASEIIRSKADELI